MAWVKMVGRNEASGSLKAEYDRIAAQFADRGGAIPEITAIMSIRPELMIARNTLSNSCTFGGSGLGRLREELIATSISALLNCRF
ncbi:MAG TPA: hypothetical protein VMV15_05350 [Candidatus Binataceae bacterium]|nr:hypothetical protein [Candidatus Binataceae bacterium]